MPRILLVEDDRNTLAGLIEILKDEGYDVVGVESGKKALKILEREQFDLMLTDLRMPDIDGLQLYERSLSYNREMKTVVMTAYSSVKDAVEAMKKGVYECSVYNSRPALCKLYPFYFQRIASNLYLLNIMPCKGISLRTDE